MIISQAVAEYIAGAHLGIPNNVAFQVTFHPQTSGGDEPAGVVKISARAVNRGRLLSANSVESTTVIESLLSPEPREHGMRNAEGVLRELGATRLPIFTRPEG